MLWLAVPQARRLGQKLAGVFKVMAQFISRAQLPNALVNKLVQLAAMQNDPIAAGIQRAAGAVAGGMQQKKAKEQQAQAKQEQMQIRQEELARKKAEREEDQLIDRRRRQDDILREGSRAGLSTPGQQPADSSVFALPTGAEGPVVPPSEFSYLLPLQPRKGEGLIKDDPTAQTLAELRRFFSQQAPDKVSTRKLELSEKRQRAMEAQRKRTLDLQEARDEARERESAKRQELAERKVMSSIAGKGKGEAERMKLLRIIQTKLRSNPDYIMATMSGDHEKAVGIAREFMEMEKATLTVEDKKEVKKTPEPEAKKTERPRHVYSDGTIAEYDGKNWVRVEK